MKFQAVTHLSIFILDNAGDQDVTRVTKVQVFGAAGQTMNVADIKKVDLEEAAAAQQGQPQRQV